MKNSFGEIKSKTLKKLTELYENNNKEEIKEFLSLIFENKDFQELYLFYDEAENLHLEYPGTAEAYVDDIQPLLKEKIKNIQETCEKLSKYLKDVVVENNELYDNLDILLETTTINNLDKKVIAKRKLIDFFSEKKNITESQEKSFTNNEKLLLTLLSNDFNSYYEKSLSESEKIILKNIISMDYDELIDNSKKLSEEILSKINKLISESRDDEMIKKLNDVKLQVKDIKPNKYNYYKLTELKNGLD